MLPQLDHFVSKPAWESICRSHMARVEQAHAVGAWWGQVPTGEGRRTEQREVDAVAVDARAQVVALGSCKWTGAPVDPSEAMLLERLEQSIPGAEHVERHYLYSRSGFSASLAALREANPERYRLVTPADVYGAPTR